MQPGGPAVRTDLAWRRTSLAATALAAIAFKAGADRHDARTVVAGVLALVAAVTYWMCGRLRSASASPRAATAMMAAAGLASALVAVAVGVVVVAGR
jgi:hypothetical protein